MAQENMDLGVVQDNKITYSVYMSKFSGYHVMSTNKPSQHWRGVVVFYCNSPHFQVEVHNQFGPSVFSFQMASWGEWWYVVGCYITPTAMTKNKQISNTIE